MLICEYFCGIAPQLTDFPSVDDVSSGFDRYGFRILDLFFSPSSQSFTTHAIGGGWVILAQQTKLRNKAYGDLGDKRHIGKSQELTLSMSTPRKAELEFDGLRS
jgi:hypothetical protein